MSQQLPNSTGALVDEKKIVEYLLNPAHRDGASKARFFLACGFDGARWQIMQAALQAQGSRNLVTKVTPHPWGARYQVDCRCPTPDGADPCIRTIWEMASVGAHPRLLTAYPLSKP